MNWPEISRARGLNIPDEALARIAPSLDSLEAAFRPLLTKLTSDIEPAIVLSEPAVFGR